MVLLAGLSLSCSQDRFSGEMHQWLGDKKSLRAAEKLLDNLGGRERWAGMKSLYIHYEQEDLAFGSYPSIQWQSLEEPKIVVDQYISNERLIRIMDLDSAWIERKGYLESMNEPNRSFLKYWVTLDYYWNLHRLAAGENLEVIFTDKNQLVVRSGGNFVFGFEVDDDFRPIVFHRPFFNDQNISLELTSWKVQDGFYYPSNGQAVSNEFKFRVLEWIPSELQPEKAFNIVFDPSFGELVKNHGDKPFQD